ncbi:hypothetical protein H7X87_01730 [Acetobacteraceae bacterium]|nr:hypothetical protein [Candidatus Parcubacteria bacterium]
MAPLLVSDLARVYWTSRSARNFRDAGFSWQTFGHSLRGFLRGDEGVEDIPLPPELEEVAAQLEDYLRRRYARRAGETKKREGVRHHKLMLALAMGAWLNGQASDRKRELLTSPRVPVFTDEELASDVIAWWGKHGLWGETRNKEIPGIVRDRLERYRLVAPEALNDTVVRVAHLVRCVRSHRAAETRVKRALSKLRKELKEVEQAARRQAEAQQRPHFQF